MGCGKSAKFNDLTCVLRPPKYAEVIGLCLTLESSVEINEIQSLRGITCHHHQSITNKDGSRKTPTECLSVT
jgi:hypothetical protein